MGKAWKKIFNSLPEHKRHAIALICLEWMIENEVISYWIDDSVDKFGNPIPDDEVAEEHFYWKESGDPLNDT